MARILITGGTGFIGQHLIAQLANNYEVLAPVRREPIEKVAGVRYETVEDLLDVESWSHLLGGVEVVIHCAAIATSLNSNNIDADFDAINTQLPFALASACVADNVSQFIFLSSIKALEPTDKYSISKHRAEISLKPLMDKMTISIVRPCMVYGHGSKGNVTGLLKVMRLPVPLPLGKVKNNKRSILYIDNLIDFICHITQHKMAGQFNLSNGDEISTFEMLHSLKVGSKGKAFLLPVPLVFLKSAGVIFNKKEVIDRLIGDLTVDISDTLQQTGWSPKFNSLTTLKLVGEESIQ